MKGFNRSFSISANEYFIKIRALLIIKLYFGRKFTAKIWGLKINQNFMEKEFVKRRMERHVNIHFYNFDVPYIWETPYFCNKSSLGNLQNRMYRDTASIGADRSSSGWTDQISVAGTADCRYYIFVCTKVWKLNEN